MSNRVSKTVTDQELNAIMWQESKGNPNAAPSTSSALGLNQFLKATWRDTVARYRPDVFKHYANGALLALRRNASFSIEMGARFAENNRRIIGADSSLGDLYLAHFLGVGTAQKFYRINPGDPAVRHAGSAAAQANRSVFYDRAGTPKTVGEVRRWSQSVMDAAGRKGGDYVGKFYTGPFVIPGEAPPTSVEVDHATTRPGLAVRGDERLYDNQLQLKSMNYNPGGLDGVWGGGTSGAIAAFLNDYAPGAIAPTKWSDYNARYSEIDGLIDKAEHERFVRPVTKERQEADPHTVERTAPEIVPAKQTFWGGITAFFTALGGSVVSAFNWLMGYKDQADQWGVMYYLDKVPTFVWWLAGTLLLGFVLYTTFRTIRGIEKPVTTGERM